ncbi:hypothetical protein CPLU01_10760 [Colletotrichum plurivorum]|uniref:Apple domain-containing protein n=1 Tax=Colletotrichum plurivorum TaxID=2175906 RepID=A0A8H6N9Q2_9PEZI|nr:hypothetical protein CPLU01_10760 [Colletotrichum plurivorum]
MEDNIKYSPSVKEKILGIFVKPSSDQKKKQQPPVRQPTQNYEPGLEVVHPLPWSRNDIALPELAPYNHVDAKTSSMPQVIDDPAWHKKKEQGLEVANSPAPPSSIMSPSTYGGSTVVASPYHQQHPGGYHHPPPTSPEPESGRICGMRRKVCYIVMAVIIVVAVAAIAIGVGAGLAFGRRPRSSSDDSGGLESTKTANITCPASDNSTFSAQDAPARHFRLICGHDYNSEDGSIDLSSENATTMAGCIDLCAARKECVGAGWGDYYGNHVCWMKSRLGKQNVSGNWYFAVDLNTTSSS